MTRDILIAGGGLAGAAAAIDLARSGRDVTLIERETTPVDKICGEFLSTEAQSYLRRLGLDAAALGEKIHAVRLIRGHRSITANLPFQGVGLTRKTLDEALLAQAASQGAKILRGHSIRNISTTGPLTVETDGLGQLAPQTLLLATGKHEARGASRRGTSSNLVGFKTYFSLTPVQQQALRGHVELTLFPGGYAGMQMVEGQKANLCLLVETNLLRRLGGKWANLRDHLQTTSPSLAARLSGAAELRDTPVTIARIPYGFLHSPQPGDSENIFRLGDQAAVIESFTGDGMSIALHSAALAANFCNRNKTAAAYHYRLRADVSAQLRRAGVLRRLLSAPFISPALFLAARQLPQSLVLAAHFTRIPMRARLKEDLLF
jgi:flavin-dependent dehydrogenase